MKLTFCPMACLPPSSWLFPFQQDTCAASLVADDGCCSTCAVYTSCSACASNDGCGWSFDRGLCLSGTRRQKLTATARVGLCCCDCFLGLSNDPVLKNASASHRLFVSCLSIGTASSGLCGGSEWSAYGAATPNATDVCDAIPPGAVLDLAVTTAYRPSADNT